MATICKKNNRHVFSFTKKPKIKGCGLECFPPGGRLFLLCLDAPAGNFILYLKFDVLTAVTMNSTLSPAI